MTIWKVQGTASEIVVFELLGRGGMGEVYDANLLGNDGIVTTCVLKTLSMVLSDEDRKRFNNETRIQAQLDHGNIVKVIGAGEIPGALGGRGTPYLLMQRVDGVDLRKLLKEVGERFSIVVSVFIAGECLTGLEYVHERRVNRRRATVAHLDLKPSNIMISSKGEVKLTDFGIARFASSVERTLSQAVGTLRYMSPEQFAGKGDEKSDIFSLGLVLFELLEGKRMWPDVDDVTYQNLIMSGQIQELTQSDVPPWLATLVRSMLALDPKDRPSAADALAIIISKFLGYRQGRTQLVEMYAEFIGEQRSGMTRLLGLEGIGLEYKRLPFPAHVAESIVERPGPTPIAAPDQPTVGDHGSDDDAPSVFRRRATPDVPAQEPTYTGGPPPLDHEYAAMHGPPPLVLVDEEPSVQHQSDPPIDPTIRLPPVFKEEKQPDANAAAPVTRQQWPTPLPAADPSTPAPRTLQTPVGRVAHPTSTNDVAPDSAPVTAARLEQSQRAAVWVIGVGGSVIIILLAVVAGLLVKRYRAEQHVEPPAALSEEPPPTKPEPKIEPIAEPTPPEPEVVPEVEVKPDAAEPDDAREPTTGTEEKTSSEPVPEVEPKPTDKPKPKAPQVLVIVKVVGSPQKAEVKVGSRNLTKKYNYAVSTNLAPGTYSISWRLPGQEAWHKPGSLVVENIGSKTYEVLLDQTKITSTIKGGGSQ